MSNPFDLRFSMITEAKALLTEQYYSEVDNIRNQYHCEQEAGLNPKYPEFPSFPTIADIKALADEMNSFVSQK